MESDVREKKNKEPGKKTHSLTPYREAYMKKKLTFWLTFVVTSAIFAMIALYDKCYLSESDITPSFAL